MELSKESLTKVLDFLPYPFIIAVTENDTVYNKFSNKKFEEEIGYSIEEIKTIDDWFLKAYPNLNYRSEIKAKWMAKIDGAMRKNRDFVVERAHITTKNRGQKWYEIKSSFTGDIQFVVFVNINEDVEKDERLERLNENKNRILSILGHDLKSPIQNLAKLTQMLIDGGLSQEEFQNNLITVQRLSKETLHFIDTTLTWTRNNFENHQPTHQEFSLNELVNNVLGLYEKDLEAKKTSPLIAIPPNTSLVSDKEVIHIALRNIISNAIKFSSIETPIIINFHQSQNKSYITVSDSGEGMPPEVIDGILKSRSNKASSSGFGIGLRLCKEILESVKGKLEIKSVVGRGTSIRIVIPQTI